DTGLWAEAQLDLRHSYVRAVHHLIDRGILGWSSGSLPHLVHVEPAGEIRRWPIVEGSLTPPPAEPRRTDVHTIKSAYAALGLDTARLLPDPSPPTPLPQGTRGANPMTTARAAARGGPYDGPGSGFDSVLGPPS